MTAYLISLSLAGPIASAGQWNFPQLRLAQRRNLTI